MKRLSGLGENHHNYDRLNLYILAPHILLYIVDHEKIIILKFIKKKFKFWNFFFSFCTCEKLTIGYGILYFSSC
jgi:hypothetical protein